MVKQNSLEYLPYINTHSKHLFKLHTQMENQRSI